MSDLDFLQIRRHDGSQNSGFEELVCQLAHLSPPENAKDFVRKDGAGGDAGVECYWKLSDDCEHAWQAKYFFRLGNSQWRQIDKSIKTALEKHPKITKYYICLPMDRRDARRRIKGKKTEKNCNKWQESVAKWQAQAVSLGMQVEFIYWGAPNRLD